MSIDRKFVSHQRQPGVALRRIAWGFVLGCVLVALIIAARNVSESQGTEHSKAGKSSAAEDVVLTEAGEPPVAATSGIGAGIEAATPDSPETKRGWSASNEPDSHLLDSSVSPMQVGGILLVVIILAVGSVILLKRLLRRTRLAASGKKVLDLVDVLPLGPKRFVYVVDLKGRTLVLGAGGDRVTLLAEYGEDEWHAGMETVNPINAVETPTPRSAQEAHTDGNLARAVAAYKKSNEQQLDASDPDLEAAVPGAHRVPPGFRHLLQRTLKEEGDQP